MSGTTLLVIYDGITAGNSWYFEDTEEGMVEARSRLRKQREAAVQWSRRKRSDADVKADVYMARITAGSSMDDAECVESENESDVNADEEN
jgi:hypothetical protein